MSAYRKPFNDRREKAVPIDRLGDEVVHAGLQANGIRLRI